MTDHADLNNIPEAAAVPKKPMKLSVVWIIPIVAALIALGIAVQQILSEGPTITIVFKAAEGIEAGKTYVKFKDVNIGQVKTVKLTADFAHVVVTAKIDKSAEGLIVEDAKFWIEQPRISLSGISGISTLLTGNYIGIKVGTSKKARREFTALEVRPAFTEEQPGKRFVLQADDLGSVGIGTPLYYRRLNVGQIIGFNLAEDGRSFNIEVFVNAPYDKYVTNESRFWHASGIDVSLESMGLSVQTQSVVSMLIGGIVFETPPTATDAKPAAAKTVFPLYADHSAAATRHETIAQPYVLYFNESMQGLNIGAPVTYLGMPVGEVTAVGLEFNPAKGGIRSRVDVVVYPARFQAQMKPSAAVKEIVRSEQERHAVMQGLIDQGARAQLRSGNLLTGKLYVAMDNFPNAPKYQMDLRKTPPELPVMSSNLADLQLKFSNILAKIEKMPLDTIGEDLKKLIATLDSAIKRIDGETLQDVKTTLGNLNLVLEGASATLVGKDAPVQQEMLKALQEITEAVKAIRGETLPEVKATLVNLQGVLESMDATLVGRDAPVQQQVRELLQETNRALQAIRGLTEYLELNPEALIRGKKQEKP